MKKLFIFDVDDVIYDLKGIIQQALADMTGKDIHSDQWHSFNLNEVYGVDTKIIFEAFHKYDILKNGVLNFDIYPLIDYLKQEGIETMAVTARGWHPEGDAITRAMFKDYDIGINKIHVVEHHAKKSDVIAGIDGFEIVGYIDDNARHIKETRELCGDNIKNYILKDQPWNRSYEIESGVTRVNKLTEVQGIIQEILESKKKPSYRGSKPF